MQIERFTQFVGGLSTLSSLAPVVRSYRVYRSWQGTWYDHSDTAVSEPVIGSALNRTIRDKRHWRERKSLESFFPVMPLEAAIVVTTEAPTHARTRESISRAIDECLRHSDDAFNASHDDLTGLLNARALDEAIILRLRTSEVDVGSLMAAPSGADARVSVALMLIDLDHFKQVNDSFGHEYGDVVLMCFANRLQVALRENTPGRCQIDFGRSGGEEFLVSVSGALTEQALRDLAERIRGAIERDVLPLESEWNTLPKNRRPAAVTLPHAADRRVTASIGLSSMSSPEGRSDARGLMNRLKAEADAALYRAKAGGRNAVRYFSAVRSSFGTVLEHHRSTGIVVIDIGQLVGVAPGHEFLVYHPDFSGARDFVFSDGRTRRRLGTYPRHSSGRLIVFDAQREISFCRIAKTDTAHEFPVGSVLEFIPAGVITHLIGSEAPLQSLAGGRLANLKEIEQEVESRSGRGVPFSVTVYTLCEMTALETAKGTAFVNQALAALYGQIDAAYRAEARISQIQTSQIAVVSELATEKECTAAATGVTERAREKCSGVADFAAGVYCPTQRQQRAEKAAEPDLQSRFALECARYAATPEALEETKVAIFSPTLAVTILYRLRQRSPADAVADYERLRKMGLSGPQFDNQGALAYLAAPVPDLARALETTRRATVASSSVLLVANRACIEYACGDFVAADASFRSAAQSGPEYVFPEVYTRVRAMAAFRAMPSGDPSSRQSISQLIEVALKSTGSPTNIPVLDSELEEALSSLRSE